MTNPAAALTPAPAELLTARGEYGAAWHARAEPMTLAEAFTAALADENIDKDAALATRIRAETVPTGHRPIVSRAGRHASAVMLLR
ncbi:hypothetical protein ACFVXG_26905 [Kitasatospora sp. NPDC058162]|uniref:hypothetical protein n=1 Tax=Kitasatospora sp. NPDC058162 TaxID=3346362 RepID=UPI0036DD9D9B